MNTDFVYVQSSHFLLVEISGMVEFLSVMFSG